MLYNTYDYNQFLGHNKLNQILGKKDKSKSKYVVYYDDDNIIYFTRGRFDNFRVDWIRNGKKQKLPDKRYFTFLYNLGKKYGNNIIWNDWNGFSLKMISDTESLIKEAERLNNIYPNTKLFWIIMGMVMYAEDIRKQDFNKSKLVYLKRNMKRLAAFNILKDGCSVEDTVHSTKGVSWRIIREWLMDRGIYIDLEYYPTALWDNIYDEIIKK